jgi:plasmid stability protein
MKNITVSVDDETYRRARIKAAERDTSVSALVRDFLNNIAAEESEHDRFQRLAREEKELRKQIPSGFSGADRLSRDELYDRRR